jgi:hypothetical protein
MPIISAFRRPRQKDSKFKPSLGYIGRTVLNKQKTLVYIEE